MAAHLISPYVPASDEISLGDACALFQETGHPVSVRTLQRLCKARGVVLVKQRGLADRASWSDLLVVHAAWVDAR